MTTLDQLDPETVEMLRERDDAQSGYFLFSAITLGVCALALGFVAGTFFGLMVRSK